MVIMIRKLPTGVHEGFVMGAGPQRNFYGSTIESLMAKLGAALKENPDPPPPGLSIYELTSPNGPN